eukprot:2506086-Rhodomonas_salina.1
MPPWSAASAEAPLSALPLSCAFFFPRHSLFPFTPLLLISSAPKHAYLPQNQSLHSLPRPPLPDTPSCAVSVPDIGWHVRVRRKPAEYSVDPFSCLLLALPAPPLPVRLALRPVAVPHRQAACHARCHSIAHCTLQAQNT